MTSPDELDHQTQNLPWHRQLDRQQKKSFIAAWLGVLLDGYDFVLITLVVTEISNSFDLSLVQGTALVSAAFISRWLGGLALGAFADKAGRKPAMIASIVLFSVASLGCALAPSFLVLFVARLIVGFAMAGEYSSSTTYVIESWPVASRNKASGFLLSGYALGVVLAAQVYRFVVPFTDEHVHPGWGWRALFLTGMAPIAVAIYMRRRIPEAADWEHAQHANPDERDMLTVLYRGSRRLLNILLTLGASAALFLVFYGLVASPIVIIVLAVLVAAVFVAFIVQFDPRRWATGVMVIVAVLASFMYSWPILGLLPTYLQDDLSMDSGVVADVLFWSGFGNAIGYIVAGFAGDRFGMTRWYCISLLLSQLLIFPVFIVGGSSVLLLGLLLFFQQMFGQGIAGLLPKWVSSYFPVEKRAAGLGFTYNVGSLGGAIGPILGALLASKLSLGFSLATISVAFAAIVMVMIGANLPRRLQRLVDPDAIRPEDGVDEVAVAR